MGARSIVALLAATAMVGLVATGAAGAGKPSRTGIDSVGVYAFGGTYPECTVQIRIGYTIPKRAKSLNVTLGTQDVGGGFTAVASQSWPVADPLPADFPGIGQMFTFTPSGGAVTFDATLTYLFQVGFTDRRGAYLDGGVTTSTFPMLGPECPTGTQLASY